MELTLEQAKEYLASVGINVPDFMLQLLVDQVNSIDACLTAAGYSNATAILIKLYALGLMTLAQGDKYISSQTAPSGASQSFRYASLSDRWKGGLGLLNGLDKTGCTDSLIPPDPTGTAHAGFWVARGGCCE
jgi:hypothetical protein